MFSLLTTLARTRYYYDSSDYGYNYNYSTTGDEGSAIAVLIVLLIFLFALIAGYVVTSLFFAEFLKKPALVQPPPGFHFIITGNSLNLVVSKAF